MLYRSPAPAAPIRLLYGNLYFGGVSSNVDAAAALNPQFSGCIGDATLNGVVVNFGNLTDIPNAIIGKCLLDTPLTSVQRPTLTPVKRVYNCLFVNKILCTYILIIVFSSHGISVN